VGYLLLSTSRNNVVYPSKGRMVFDGGLNSKFERSIIAENESPSCANVVFTNGAVETRGGAQRLNTAAIGSFVGDGLYTRRDNTGAETMVAFAGGTMWQLGVTSFTTVASAQSVFTAGVRVGTTQYENKLFIGNGGVTPYKYDGTYFTRHGVPRASVSGFTGTASATGGTHSASTMYYKVAFVNSHAAIGDVSTATTAFAVGANGSIELTGIPVAPTSHGVASRRIYRATTATGGTYGLIATLNDNSTTTLSDTNLPASTAAPTDNGEPPIYNVICYHQNRLFCNDTANPNYVWYSELLEPYTFASTNFLAIGDASRDLVKGLEVYNNSILVTCEMSTHLIYMPSSDDSDWQVIRILAPFGSRSPYATFLYENKAMVAAMQNGKFIGFGAISGTSIDPAATLLTTSAAGSELQSDRVEPDMFQVQEAYVGNISAMVFKNKAYIAVTHGDGNTTNNRVWVFDFSKTNLSKSQNAAWSPITGLSAAQFTIYNGFLYYIESTATGFVNRLETTTYADNASAINSFYWTKELSGNPGHENLQKDFRWVKLLVEKLGAYYMNPTYRVDSDNGEGTTLLVDLTNSSDTWGSRNWGVMVWGAGSAQEEVTVPLGQVTGKRVQFRFSNQNTSGQRFKVHGLNLNYNIKGRR
jgi:hypothetical protein